MIEIPRFNLNEFYEIKNLLNEAGVPFETKTQIMYADEWGGTHEYYFYVASEHLNDAVIVIKKYYGMSTEPAGKFSGQCPACGFEVRNVSKCPDCGLNLTGDRTPGLTNLPFYEFLQKKGLLEANPLINRTRDFR